MSPFRTPRTLLAFLIGGLALTAGAFAQAEGPGAARPVTIQVTVTNLSAGQIMSDPVVISHNGAFQLFTAGAAASSELAMLAEDAVTGPLVAAVGADPNVFDVEVAPNGIGPGQSVTVSISANGAHRYFSVAGMLVSTNDAFYAVQGLEAKPGTETTHAIAYDAGSEANNEDCTYIPGPPCGNPGVRTATSEGFIHVSNGIHGIASLAEELFDWRNPVARVSVTFSPPSP